jgi:hypothetical protein
VTELQIHKAVVKHLRQRGCNGLVFFYVPNGVKATGRKARVQGGIAKGMGARAGVSDLILLKAGQAYALELKTDKGRPTIHQMQFASDFNAAGGNACIVNGLDRALRVLETWGLLTGRVV